MPRHMGWEPAARPLPHLASVSEALGDVDGRLGSIGVARCVRMTSMDAPPTRGGGGGVDPSGVVPWAALLTPMDRAMGDGVGEPEGSEAWEEAVRQGRVPRVARAPRRCTGCGACVSPFCEERGRGIGDSMRGRRFVDMACPMCGKVTRMDGVDCAEALPETRSYVMDYVPPSQTASRGLRETLVFVVDETLDEDELRGAQETILACVEEMCEAADDESEALLPRIALVTAGQDVSVYELGVLHGEAEPRADCISAIDPSSIGMHEHPLGALDWAHVEGVLFGGAVHAAALPRAFQAFETALRSIRAWNRNDANEDGDALVKRPRCLVAAIEVAIALCAGGKHASRWGNGFESALTVADPRKRCWGGSIVVLAGGPCNTGVGALRSDSIDNGNAKVFVDRERVISHMAGIGCRANRAGVSIHIYGTGLCPPGVTTLEPLCGGTGGRIMLLDTFLPGVGDNAVIECFGRNLKGALNGRFGRRAGVQLRHSQGIKISNVAGALGDGSALPAAREYFLEDRETPSPAARYSCLGGAAREDMCFTLFLEVDESRGRSLASRLLGPLILAGVELGDEDGSGERVRHREYLQVESVLILPSGRRVLRVVTLALPTAESLEDFLRAQDVHALVVALAKSIVVADREEALDRMKSSPTGFHGRVGDPESVEIVGRRLRDIALVFDGRARGTGLAQRLLGGLQGVDASYACLPSHLEMLPSALWHLCHGPLLGVIAQHADQVEELRTCLLLASVQDALLMIDPVCECVVPPGNAVESNLRLQRVAPDSLSLRSDRVVLLDAGTDMMLWIGRKARENAAAVRCAKVAAIERIDALGRWPVPRLKVVFDGDGQARFVTSRLNPAHRDAAEDQAVWHPDVADMDDSTRLSLMRSMPPTDNTSILGWLRTLKVHVPRTDKPSRSSHVGAPAPALASAGTSPLASPRHMVIERTAGTSPPPSPASRLPAVFV